MKIEEILKEYNIDYVTSGKNVSSGNIGLNCPFCGDDTSYHLGINSRKGVYSCWREPSHKGSVYYLLSFLLGISLDEAKKLLYDKYTVSTTTIEEKRICGGKTKIEFPDNFRKIDNSSITRKYYNYLVERGYDNTQEFIDKYNIKCCISGKWAERVIFPIYMNKKLMSWIGRSVLSNPYLRYRDLEVALSVRHPKYCLYNYDNLLGGDTLYIMEGVFDALKMDWYGSINNSSTCLFTLNITDEQILLLLKICDKYKRIILLLDKGAELRAINLSGELSFIKNLSIQFVPDGFKDIGEMTKEDINVFF